jgi:NAD+ synthase (glutamine-hydrolysing)
MPTLRIALAQINSTVGAINANADRVRHIAREALAAGAHLVAFPEMMLTGYPVEDLTFRDDFVRASQTALRKLARDLADDGCGELAVIVGFLDADGPARLGADSSPRTGPRDSLALLHRGEVAMTYDKHHLPNYGVFDENRYFVPGEDLTIVRATTADGPVDIALTVCEDIWQAGGPFAAAGAAKVGLIVNINASPYERNKDDVRLPLVARRAAEAGAMVAYVNLVGAQDELTFDGDSMIVDADGRVLTRSRQFIETLIVHDIEVPLADTDRPTPPGAAGMTLHLVPLETTWATPDGHRDGGIADRMDDLAEVWNALVLGLRDYVEKNAFRSVVFGLSGGIDSSVVAALSVDALGPERVVGVSMPSAYSSEHSKDDAADLAKRTGLDYRIEPVADMVDAFLSNLNLSGLAVENLQARVRAVVLMALSNQEGHLVLTTGNKSELAVGYSTLYGDSAGGFNPLKDVPKTLVWQLARWRNEYAQRTGQVQPIPENSISKPPSAELRPGQLDTDSLPDYGVLDPILAGYIDRDEGRDALIKDGHDPQVVDKVLRMTDAAEYKRRQSAPGTKISFKAFGRDRRLPITNRWREGA